MEIIVSHSWFYQITVSLYKFCELGHLSTRFVYKWSSQNIISRDQKEFHEEVAGNKSIFDCSS